MTTIIIRCKAFFLFIGWVLITWPANNCLQIMVCSCAMSSNFVWLQIIFCSCVNETTLPEDIHWKTNSMIEWYNNYWTRLPPKYRDLSVSNRSIDLLATDKSRYFGQPRPIIVNSLFIYPRNTKELLFSFSLLFQQKPCGNKNEFNWILQGEVDIHILYSFST